MDTAAAAAAITTDQAIMPVHLYGQPADMDPLLALALTVACVVEDAAQRSAAYRGRPCGSMGIAAGFSFYPGKNLGAYGDGGAITTNDDGLAQEIRLLRNWGSTVKYVHTRMGFNSRLDTMQAAVLLVKLPHLETWNARRNEVADAYRAAFAGVPSLGIIERASWTSKHAYHLSSSALKGRATNPGRSRRGSALGITRSRFISRRRSAAAEGHGRPNWNSSRPTSSRSCSAAIRRRSEDVIDGADDRGRVGGAGRQARRNVLIAAPGWRRGRRRQQAADRFRAAAP